MNPRERQISSLLGGTLVAITTLTTASGFITAEGDHRRAVSGFIRRQWSARDVTCAFDPHLNQTCAYYEKCAKATRRKGGAQ